MFGFKPFNDTTSVAGILSGFKQMSDQLKVLAQAKSQEVAEYDARIIDLDVKRTEAISENEKALAAQAKLENFFS